MVAQPVFFDNADWIPQPVDWPGNLTSGKSLDLAVGEGKRVWDTCRAREPLLAADGAVGRDGYWPGYGAPQLVKPRLGQGIFRVSVTEAYGRACAITKEHSLPVIEAAHIKPYAVGGPHAVSNGLALRADLHRLFDQGYLTVTRDYHVEVSSRLKTEWQNGKIYYPHHGARIHLPSTKGDAPDPAFLQWHNEKVFRP